MMKDRLGKQLKYVTACPGSAREHIQCQDADQTASSQDRCEWRCGAALGHLYLDGSRRIQDRFWSRHPERPLASSHMG